MTTTQAQAIIAAIDALLAAGVRPTVRGIREHIIQEHDSGPSFRDIAPVLRAWREKQRAGRNVLKVVSQYNALNAEERAQFLELAGLTRKAAGERMHELAKSYRSADDDDRQRLQNYAKRGNINES